MSMVCVKEMFTLSASKRKKKRYSCRENWGSSMHCDFLIRYYPLKDETYTNLDRY